MIKYRRYDEHTKKMEDCSMLTISELNECKNVMQYIGKNKDQELFDCDIVKVDDSVFQVYWDPYYESWALRKPNEGRGVGSLRRLHNIGYNYTIIGNIYQHPQLMEV